MSFCVMSGSKDVVSIFTWDNSKQWMDSFKDLLAETVGQIKLMIQQRFGRAADQGDQKRKFNQVHKLMKQAKTSLTLPLR